MRSCGGFIVKKLSGCSFSCTYQYLRIVKSWPGQNNFSKRNTFLIFYYIFQGRIELGILWRTLFLSCLYLLLRPKAKQEDELLSYSKLELNTVLIMKDMEIEKSFTKEDYRSQNTKALKIIMAIKKSYSLAYLTLWPCHR